ncbi:MAG: hypothetical protein AMJ56_11075 [Anaerolineae bacterium SG8_19]|nr:MAG: hypothetical protein AMJ56_11075 [Anaerolineae bacterium SG8_19]
MTDTWPTTGGGLWNDDEETNLAFSRFIELLIILALAQMCTIKKVACSDRAPYCWFIRHN